MTRSLRMHNRISRENVWLDGRADGEEADDRPPICPACGVTQGIVATEGEPRYVCLECGFSDDALLAADDPR